MSDIKDYEEYRNKQDEYCEKYKKNLESCIEVSCPLGWMDMVIELTEKCLKLQPDLQILQIKSKFGGLRFYVGSALNEVHDLIDEAENKSYSLCEECGMPAKSVNLGWVYTVCPKHEKQIIETRDRQEKEWREKQAQKNEEK